MGLFNHQYTLKTKNSPTKVKELLNNNISNSLSSMEISYTKYRCDKTFRGKLTGNNFRIRRCIKYKNIFLPNIIGEINKSFDGTYVEIRMELHQIAKFFSWIFTSSIIIAMITGFVFISPDKSERIALWLLPLIIFWFFFITYTGFHFEKDKAVKLLNEILGSNQ